MDYTPDNAALEAKEAEIQRLLLTFAEKHPSLVPSEVQKLIGSCVRVTAPLNPPAISGLITMDDLGRGGGISRKPGNITLNWASLFQLVPGAARAVGGAIGDPWLMLFAALELWGKLSKVLFFEVTLMEEDAFVVFSLWLHRDGKNKIAEDDAFLKTKALAKKHGISLPTKKRFREIVSKLLLLGCIEIESGVIRLIERVRITY